jgi:hypothetical protein
MKLLACLLLLSTSFAAFATEILPLSKGQAVYLPIYSHIWYGDRLKTGKPEWLPLSALVSIRNTDLQRTLTLTSAKYYDTDGKFLQEFVPAPVKVGPMGTHEILIERKESAGGSGANFVIRWEATQELNAPIIEAVHAEARAPKSLSFVTSGRVMPRN